ncbi:hypothetical protein ACQKWADRAFT_325165 [Trichoderma austrokoningii]
MASSDEAEGRNADGDSSQSKDEDPTIVLGIDFGTTQAHFSIYSGVAWAISTRLTNISTITSWDSAKYYCSDKEKTPSIISYEENGKILWGYSVSDKKSSIEWSKLCLLEGDDIPQDACHSTHLQAAQEALKQHKKTVVEVISDYLRQLWKHSIINIRRAIGGQLVDLCRFKFVATIPAIWPIYAQMRMHEAIEKAGILSSRNAGQTTLEFLAEPEAAALATLRGISSYNQANMEVGDHFVVCDAGGGTVDVITYTVVELSPLKVKKSVKGDGKLCGATFLDERFLIILKEKLDLISPDTWKTLQKTGALERIINNDWENGIKPQFRNTDRHWMIQIPVQGPKRTHDEFRFSNIKLEVEDAQKIFKPIVADIKDLVEKQMKAIELKYHKEPKGETIPVSEPISRGYYADIEKPVKKYSIDLIYSTSATPPKRCDETVKTLYNLHWSKVPNFKELSTWVNPKGRTVRRFCYDVEMTSNGVTLDFEIKYNRQIVASKDIGIDYGHCGDLAINYS